MSKKGFTLVELLIVIAIMGILAAIAIPSGGGLSKTFQSRADVEAAKTLARTVDTKVLAGDLDPGVDDGSGYNQIDASELGEPLPIPQGGGVFDIRLYPKGSDISSLVSETLVDNNLLDMNVEDSDFTSTEGIICYVRVDIADNGTFDDGDDRSAIISIWDPIE